MTTHQATQRPPRGIAIISQIFPRLLGVLFIFTSVQKILRSAALHTVLQFDHLPEKLIAPTTWTIIAVEISIGILLLTWPRKRILSAAIVLLLLYTVQIIYLLITHNAPNCNCLGGVLAFENARRANFLSLTRNLLLVLATWLTWLMQR